MFQLSRLLAEVRAQRVYPTAYRAVRKLHRRVMDGELFTTPRATPAEIEVVSGPRREAFWADLLAGLVERGVPYTVGGSDRDWRHRLHLRGQDAEALFALLEAIRPGEPALFQEGHQPHLPLTMITKSHRRRRFTRFDLWLLERPTGGPEARRSIWAPPTQRPEGLFTVIEVDFWGSPERSFRAEPYAVAPRPNEVATSMRWRELDQVLGVTDPATRASDLADVDPLPDLHARDFPIDIVYTWVDDQDPAWRMIKNEHLPDGSKITVGEGRADHAERFRNRDELRYSLRSIEMFAPFVRNVYLVTMDQTPDWLNLDHPKLTVVSHSDIYADSDALPTFNSSSIETQLHHIDGLAEHFLYFNDDVFLGRPCSWRDFFWAGGATKFFPANHSVSANLIHDQAEEYLIADRNAIRLLETEFGKTVHQGMMHTPHAARRSVLDELEQKYGEQFAACAASRFRSRQDLRPIAFFGHHYGFATGRAMPAGIGNRYLALWKPQIAAQLAGVLRSRRYQTFCINDVGVTDEREEEVDGLVGEFLESYFPLPSSFER